MKEAQDILDLPGFASSMSSPGVAKKAAALCNKAPEIVAAFKTLEDVRNFLYETFRNEAYTRYPEAHTLIKRVECLLSPAVKKVPTVQATDGGPNPLYEGQYDGETIREAYFRCHWAKAGMQLERESSTAHETGIVEGLRLAAAWHRELAACFDRERTLSTEEFSRGQETGLPKAGLDRLHDCINLAACRSAQHTQHAETLEKMAEKRSQPEPQWQMRPAGPLSVMQALLHVRDHCPGVDRVIYGPGRVWEYMGADGYYPILGTGVDANLLDLAASEAPIPSVFFLVEKE